MPGLQTVYQTKATVLVGKDQAARVTNTDAAATLYVKSVDSVSSSSSDFTITTGAQRIVTGPAWAVGSVDLLALVDDIPVPASSPIAATRHWVGGAQLTSTGTDTTPTANRVQLGQLTIGNRCVLTGVGYLIGSVGGTDKAIAALYDSTGKMLVSSAIAGVTVGTANTYQELPFTAPFEVVVPGKYFVGVMMNGTTARIRTALANGVISGTVNSATDFSAAPISVTAPSTVTVNGSALAYTY
jgi:hypothetical protein